MITVIDENEYYEGQYDNMTLAEAGDQFVTDIIESANEMQMDVLLYEHSYLYENGVELDYLTEAEDKENIIKRFISWVKDKAWPAIRDFFKRAMDAVYEFFAVTIPNMFKKIGLNKKKFDELVAKYNGSEKCESVTEWVNYNALNNLSVATNFSGVKNSANPRFGGKIVSATKEGEKKPTYSMEKNGSGYTDFKKKSAKEASSTRVEGMFNITSKYEGGIPVTKEVLQSAGSIIFNKNTILKDMSKHKAAANSELNNAIKMARKVKNDDQVKYLIQDYTIQIKENSKIYRQVVKYYAKHVSNCAKVIRFAMSKTRKQKGESSDSNLPAAS